MLALTALIIDGGNVWAQQRIVQNASDAAAEAGAFVMGERLNGQPTPAGGWDQAVWDGVQNAAQANGVEVEAAYYTDICGIPLTPWGTAALNGDGTENLAIAARVDSGYIPTSTATNPDCPNRIVGPPAGVLVIGHKTVQSYVAGIVGITTFDPTTRATAVAGWLTGFCDASQGEACSLLPIAVPVNIVTCDDQNKPLNTLVPWSTNVVYKVPLCQSGPGNVGWLDWYSTGGGTPDIIHSIQSPDNPPIDLPSWQDVSQTGNPNSGGIESALRAFDGQLVLLPMFDVTCGAQPDNTQVAEAPSYGCPAGELMGGHGNANWYRMPTFAAFQLCSTSIEACGGLHGAYTQGTNTECDSGNGATSCLVGQFVNFIASGTVSAGYGGGPGPTKIVGVQLIK